MRTQSTSNKKSRGFTLVELMVSIVIGLFLIAGVFKVFNASRKSQRVVDDQVQMVDNARFALDVISSDIRQSGVYGRVKQSFKVNKAVLGYSNGGCVAANWVQDVDYPVRAYDDGVNSALTGVCAGNYSKGDIIEMRYTLVNSVPAALLQAGKVYINGNVNESQFFEGNASPNLDKSADYEYVANAYYIASYTDVAGDGIPSLHRITLQQNQVTDQVLLAGVEDMQIQIGIDSDSDGKIDQYVDPNAANFPPGDLAAWDKARSVEVWLVVRSLRTYPDLDTVTTANIAGNSVTLPANGTSDGIRRIVVSTVATLRNR